MKLASKKLYLTGVAVAVVAAAATLWIVAARLDSDDTAKSNQQSSVVSGTAASPKADKISYDGVEGKNALELLKASHNATTQSSSLGDYVTGIDGVEGNGPKYWLFYVNDKQAEVGAGAYLTKATDKIEWRLE